LLLLLLPLLLFLLFLLLMLLPPLLRRHDGNPTAVFQSHLGAHTLQSNWLRTCRRRRAQRAGAAIAAK
jgi:hypothetical protein